MIALPLALSLKRERIGDAACDLYSCCLKAALFFEIGSRQFWILRQVTVTQKSLS